MSFHDDSHILARLGILQSKDECPRKIHHSTPKTESKKGSEKERFVEVNIDGEVASRSDSDEEPVFDRHSLLSANRSVKVYRRKSESYKCVYLILLLTYFATGAVWSVPLLKQRTSIKSSSNFLSVYLAGLLAGTTTGKLLCQRLSITFVSFICTILLTGFSWTFSDFPEVIDARVSIFMLGFGSGTILYGGLATWFIHWRGYNRKVVLFYVIMAFGSSIALAINNQPILSAGSYNSVTSSITLHKREVIGASLENDTVLSTNDSISLKPKKPQVAQGIQVIETKSEQNEQMRKAASSNKSQTPSASSSASAGLSSTATAYLVTTHASPNSSRASTPQSTPKTTVLVTTTTHMSSIPTPSRTSIIVPETQYSTVKQSTHDRFASISTTVTLALYAVAFISCCVPCTTRSDAKFLKLFDQSVSGLTRGCRIRLTVVQTIASFNEGMVAMGSVLLSSEGNNSSILFLNYAIITIFRAVIVMCGPCAYSLPGCCLALLCALVGSGLTLLVPVDPLVGYALMSASTGVFGLLVLLYLEVRVCPRAGTQLDYYVFPSVSGRLLSALLCTIIKPSTSKQVSTIILLSNAPLTLVFMLLVKSISKAARLKEIMEYSSSPVLETAGEYVSLIERDVGSDSGEEEDGSFANREL
ncbi:hypothetical protein GCK32_002800 [Trichostrongylus colubriformis]|uniref:Uncharacterized protein n=1 Tax=Trichostrongylus colubriformis TaxID=6319 RepID=A0AAN8FGL1_TRICO